MTEDERPPAPLWDLVQTAHLAARRFSEVFEAAGLTPAQYGVLASLADGDDLSPADLARAVLVRPQSMQRLVADMVGRGLVVRTGPGGRGRRTGLALAPAGAQALDQARPAAYALNTPAAHGLSDAEAAELVRVLDLLRTHLGADPDAGDGA